MTKTAVQEDLASKASFLRQLAVHFEKRHVPEEWAEECSDIADLLENLSPLFFEPSRQLEAKAEETLSGVICCIVDHIDVDIDAREITLALWLLQRRLKSAGSQSLLGGGLSAIGGVSLAKLVQQAAKPEGPEK